MVDDSNTDTGRDFESRLQEEVDRVLADPAFQRSPVQSRLLRYLCDQTVARARDISQIAIAVDGLGRPETIDQLTESYPRVQISRLRRNLSLYYARCAPGDGLAVYIRHGDYHLRLARPESAYGSARPPPTERWTPANDSAEPEPDTAASVPERVPLPPRLPGSRRILAIAVLIVLLATAGLWFASRPQPGGPRQPPALEIQIGGVPGEGASDNLLVLAAQHAEDIASNSYVVRSLQPEEPIGGAGYVVRLQFSETVAARPVIEVSLFDRSNQRLFHDSIPTGGDRSTLLARVHGAMLQIVGPVGMIARRELASVGDEPQDDYACVLKAEADRLRGSASTSLIEGCLLRFPESPYRGYWLARMAFMGYRDQVLAGGVVEPSGASWDYLRKGFAADPTNPFVNYVTAKVYLAQGDCETARPLIERAMQSGNFHGTLIAAALADASLCPGTLIADHDAETRIESLVEAVPEPNPLLRVYLIFATAALDRPDLSRRMLASPKAEGAQGPMADINAALESSLGSPGAFDRNRDRLQQVVDGFYWGRGSRRDLMVKLEAVAAYPTCAALAYL
jgi:hypothetical protein